MEDETNACVRKLWEETFSQDDDVHQPLVYGALKKDSLLFVGFNPSMPSRGIKFLKDHWPDLKYDEFFSWRNREQFDLQKALQIEQITKERYSFFRRFQEIASELRASWEHIDLFFYRDTSQASFRASLFTENGALTKFGEAQLQLAVRLITHSRPKLVVVANADAARQFGKRFDLLWNEGVGYHTTLIAGRSVPVFLSSMLTGQRALDNHSYERLRWHIRKAWAGLQ